MIVAQSPPEQVGSLRTPGLTGLAATGIIPADREVQVEKTVGALRVYRCKRRDRGRGRPDLHESQARRSLEETVSERGRVLAAHGQPVAFHGVFDRPVEKPLLGSFWLCVLDH